MKTNLKMILLNNKILVNKIQPEIKSKIFTPFNFTTYPFLHEQNYQQNAQI